MSRIRNPALGNEGFFIPRGPYSTESPHFPALSAQLLHLPVKSFFLRKNSQKMILKMKRIACTLMLTSACRMDSWSQSTARTFSWGKAVEIAMLKRKAACHQNFHKTYRTSRWKSFDFHRDQRKMHVLVSVGNLEILRVLCEIKYAFALLHSRARFSRVVDPEPMDPKLISLCLDPDPHP